MEGLTLTQANNLANTVSIKAIAATRIAGVRISRPTRTLHSPSMKKGEKAKSYYSPFQQVKNYMIIKKQCMM